jgi:hypothetical protein
MGVQTPNRDPSANDERPDRPEHREVREERESSRARLRDARASQGAASANKAERTGRAGGESSARGSAGSTAYVLEPGGPCNVYRWDAESGLRVLERVLHPARALGADLVQLPLLTVEETLRHTTPVRRSSWVQSLREGPDVAERLAAMGPALLALLLAQPANPPGTRVGIRLLGAVRLSHPLARETRTIPARGGAAAATVAGGGEKVQPVQHHLVADCLAVGVPSADETLAHITALDDLPPALMERLQHALQRLAPEALAAGQESESWLSAGAIRTRYREARAAIRRAERAEEAASTPELPGERLFAPRAAPAAPAVGGRPSAATGAAPATLPAWRELSPVTPAELRALGEAAYSAPEYLLRWIPHRFEHYLNDLLLPDERVLFFAESPALTIRDWPGAVDVRTGRTTGAGVTRQSRGIDALRPRPFERLRTRHLHGGLLLITDRQILHVRDYAPPDMTLVEWGYLAQSWPLGRLVSVRLLPAGVPLSVRSLVEGAWPPEVLARLAGVVPFSEVTVPDRFTRLVVALDASGGVELVGAAFPTGTEPLLERAAARIQRFVPALGAAAGKGVGLRVVPHVEPWQPTEREARELETLGGLVTPEAARALEDATRVALTTDEQVLVQARTPEAGGGSAAVPALLTLTDRRLLLARVPTAMGGAVPGAEVQAWPLAAISSAVLQQSMLGSGLIAHVPHATSAASAAAGARSHAAVSVEPISLAFPSPLLVPFRALYTRLRLLLGGPSAA